jgi:hypothetical protein
MTTETDFLQVKIVFILQYELIGKINRGIAQIIAEFTS